jgi:predicted Zn-dependent protease
MPRSTWLPVIALISLAAACKDSDQSRTTSTTSGAVPTVSATTVSAPAEEPAVTPVSYEGAESVFSEGRYPEAAQLFAAYTGTHPENPWGHYMLGMSAWRAGDREQAMSAFDQALRLDSTHRKSLFNSGRVLLETGRAKEALERIQKALNQEQTSNEGLRLLGRASYETGNVDSAIQAYHRALAIDERDVWSMNNLGLIYIQQERSSEAIPPLARAVELRSNSPVFQNNLATALERSGYPTAAAQAYEAALAADSTYAKASVGLARVTGGGQQPESTSVDLAALSRGFQDQIETWRLTATVQDSAEAVSDSVLISGGEVSDTLHEERADDL